jgi:hypothetical protein
VISNIDLDGLMAEDVMGWKMDRYAGCQCGRLKHYKGECFTPSESMADAWKVAEKLTRFDDKSDEWPFQAVALFNAQKGQVGARVYSCPPGCPIWEGDGRVLAEEVADSAPRAICLVALKALGVELRGVV